MSDQTPVVVICGINDDALVHASGQAQCSLPDAALVSHTFDPMRDTLTRKVFDISGEIDHETIFLDGNCVGCTTREDLLDTLERLASTGRWSAIIAQLPVTIEPLPLHFGISLDPERTPHVRIGSIVVGLSGETLEEDALGPDYLIDAGLPVRADDQRGTAEVLADMIESADVVTIAGETTQTELDLVRILARPDTQVIKGFAVFEEPTLLKSFNAAKTETWQSLTTTRDGYVGSEHIWVLNLRSDRPFHPQRLMDNVEALANWPIRTRGQFWLPTRPAQICYWSGAGGSLSIGPEPHCASERPVIRIFVVGSGDGRAEINDAFQQCLLTDAELEQRGYLWEELEDGFEPWLGPIRQLMEAH